MRTGKGDGCVSVKQESVSRTDGKERAGEKEKCGKCYSSENQMGRQNKGERERKRKEFKRGVAML